MTEVKFKPKTLELSVEGHAEYAEKGKDIVCASVSILFYTLADSLENSGLLAKPLKKTVKEGKCSLKAVPIEQYLSNVEMIYWTILNGINLLAEDYPENVKLTIL